MAIDWAGGARRHQPRARVAHARRLLAVGAEHVVGDDAGHARRRRPCTAPRAPAPSRCSSAQSAARGRTSPPGAGARSRRPTAGRSSARPPSTPPSGRRRSSPATAAARRPRSRASRARAVAPCTRPAAQTLRPKPSHARASIETPVPAFCRPPWRAFYDCLARRSVTVGRPREVGELPLRPSTVSVAALVPDVRLRPGLWTAAAGPVAVRRRPGARRSRPRFAPGHVGVRTARRAADLLAHDARLRDQRDAAQGRSDRAPAPRPGGIGRERDRFGRRHLTRRRHRAVVGQRPAAGPAIRLRRLHPPGRRFRPARVRRPPLHGQRRHHARARRFLHVHRDGRQPHRTARSDPRRARPSSTTGSGRWRARCAR